MNTQHNDARREKLDKTWTLMADAILRALEVDEPSAASLEVARKWLDANGVTLDTLRDWRRGIGAYGPLPTFSDDDDTDEQTSGGGSNDALAKVPPFEPAED